MFGIAVGLTIYNKDGKGAFQLTESMALTLGVTYGLKYTVNDKQPNGGTHSFPSVHTSASFSAAEFMRERYGWEYGVPAYLLASFVGYSLMANGAKLSFFCPGRTGNGCNLGF